jgi:MoxR-like ATPase
MEESIFNESSEVFMLQNKLQQIRSEIGKVIVGQHQVVDLLMVGLLSDGHILIEGVPGVAKTLTSKLLAQIIDVHFSRIQFTPDLMPSDVIGTSVFNPKEGNFYFKPGPIFGNVVLIDEINRAPAKTQSALFEVMEERQITVDGTTHPMQYPFLVLATQNPIEQEGTYRLPEAQLDRFLFKIEITYPTLQEEITILSQQHNKNSAEIIGQVNKLLSAQDLANYRAIIQNIKVEDTLLKYIANIIVETRNNSFLYLGASPRASLALLKASKAFAALQGRDFIIPEDVQQMAPHVLRHRIMLTPEKEMEGVTPNVLIENILKAIEVPR